MRVRDRNVAILMIAAVVAIPFMNNSLLLYGMTVAGIFAVPVVGLNMLTGVAGQVSFGQVAFLELGAYGSALLTTRYGLDPYLALVCAAALAGIASFVVGVVVLRLTGFYLAVGTFALALAVGAVLPASGFFGSAEGIVGITPFTIGGFNFAVHPIGYYVVAWVLFAVSAALYWSLIGTHVGRAWRTVALQEEVARSVGINAAAMKVLAFVIAGVFTALAGSLYVELTGVVGPDTFGTSLMVSLFFMLFIGGQRSVVGPALGAAIFILAPQYVPALQSHATTVFSALLLATIILLPTGVLGERGETKPLKALLPRRVARRIGRLPSRPVRGAPSPGAPDAEIPEVAVGAAGVGGVRE